jgi:4,5-DOPA dioxygenase extradiol
MTKKIAPSVFLGHGSPMNIVANNNFVKALREFGFVVKPKVKAVLCISAYWQSEGLFVSRTNKLGRVGACHPVV